MNTLAKLNYFLTAVKLSLSADRKKCPCCSIVSDVIVDRKYGVTTLRRCRKCSLQYRTPITTPEENKQFYQHEYKQGTTTDCPSSSELKVLMERKFANTERDYAAYIKLMQSLGIPKGARILDYGCSWGYGSWQLRNAGFEVTAFEISEPRAAYAREKLGVKVYSRWEDITEKNFDLFFSAHVLEHVPSPLTTFQYARDKLKDGGLFMAFTPNGSVPHRERDSVAWSRLWGLVHPNFLDSEFYQKHFPHVTLTTAPYDGAAIKAKLAAGTGGAVNALAGYELLALTPIRDVS